jgi:hypothetical protein
VIDHPVNVISLSYVVITRDIKRLPLYLYLSSSLQQVRRYGIHQLQLEGKGSFNGDVSPSLDQQSEKVKEMAAKVRKLK